MKSVKGTKKALITTVMCLICMISALAFSVDNTYADEDYEVQISLDKEEVHIGDTVKATVKLTKNAGIAGFTMHISYDTNVLEFVSAEAMDDVLLSPSVKKDTDATGKVGYSYASEDNVEGTGDILIITFKVRKDAGYGESVLDFAKLDGATSTSETTVSRINIVGQNATLNVVEECQHVLTQVPAKAATVDSEGNIEYFVCSVCNGYFKDAEGKESIDKEDTIIPKLDVNPDDIYFSKSNNTTVFYNPYNNYTINTTFLNIEGSNDKSDITKLKSSKKDIKLEACDGYIIVRYGNKSQKTTITCEVKGVKLKTTLKIIKYRNPFKSIKLGGRDYTKGFNKNLYIYTKKKYKNNTLAIKCKSGWKIRSIKYTKQGSKHLVNKYYKMCSSTVSKKAALYVKGSEISICAENKSLGIRENFVINLKS